MKKSSLLLSHDGSSSSLSVWLLSIILLWLFISQEECDVCVCNGFEQLATAKPTTTTLLHNGVEFPLVGLGVGNLQHEKIVTQIVEGMKYGTRLIDTAHSSQNEHLVRQGVIEGLEALTETETTAQIHVVTKIWYTYLGYERTKIAAREILEVLNHPNINVHILIHWPRCNDDIPWMECAKEEDQLPSAVQNAGPPPHLNKDEAYKESWRALEDIYRGDVTFDDSHGVSLPKPASIGVSNFNVADLEGLEVKRTDGLRSTLRVMPHLVQDDIWSYIHDPQLIKFCEEQSIHFQAYNVMNGIFQKAEELSPEAYAALETRSTQNNMNPFQLVLKWLIEIQSPPVSIIPRTASLEHVRENSEMVLASLFAPDDENATTLLSEDDIETIRLCVTVMLEQRDLDPPLATFHNQHDTTALHIFWSKEDGSGEEHLVTDEEGVQPGGYFDTTTYPGHTFIAYDSLDKTKKGTKFTVAANFGQKEEFSVEL